jgi:hypothetical protein
VVSNGAPSPPSEGYTLANASDEVEQPPETGVLPHSALEALEQQQRIETPPVASTAAASTSYSSSSSTGFSYYPPSERSSIRESWETLMRWSKVLRTKSDADKSPLEMTNKVVVFGGGSFGTAMGAALARQKADLEVVLLLRDPYLCQDINQRHSNTKYLKVCARRLRAVCARVALQGCSWPPGRRLLPGAAAPAADAGAAWGLPQPLPSPPPPCPPPHPACRRTSRCRPT